MVAACALKWAETSNYLLLGGAIAMVLSITPYLPLLRHAIDGDESQ
jgi:hypothetical protein